MPDYLTNFSMLINMVSGIVKSCQSALAIAERLKDSEMQLALSEVIKSLADANLKIAETQNNYLQLESDYQTLKQRYSKSRKLVFKEQFYEIENKKNMTSEFFCVRCFDVNGMLVHLQRSQGRLLCPECYGRR